MGTSSTTLYTLGADALAEITNLIAGSDVYHLWLCGSRALNHKLGVGGGARVFHVKSTDAFEMPWPGLVSYLPHLHTFRLLSDAVSMTSRVTDVDFTKLPSSITHINVTFDRDHEYLIDALTRSPAHFARLTYVRLNGPTLITNAGRQGDLMRALPSSVSTVIICKLIGGFVVKQPRQMTAIDMLPNLQTLVASHVYMQPNDTDEHQMSNLTSYVTSATCNAWMSALPTHLQSLSLGVLRNDYLHLLPPTLTFLSVYRFETESVFVAALPRTLTKLTILSFDAFLKKADVIRTLPAGIKTINGNFSSPIITAKKAAALPRSLTLLRHKCAHPNAIKSLPPGISRLVVRKKGTDDALILTHRLPISCTYLLISTLNESSIGRLPAALLTLCVEDNVETLACLAHLPASLTSLIIRGKMPSEAHPVDYIPLLPKGLRSFSSAAHPMTYSTSAVSGTSSRDLPPTLERCNIALNNLTTASTWYADLPTTIQCLTLTVNTFSVECASALHSLTRLASLTLILVVWDVNLLSHLPRTLERLFITSTHASSVHTTREQVCALLASLPPQLAECRIPALAPVDEKMQEYLPKMLTSFMIGYRPVSWFVPLPQRPRELTVHH